MEKFKFDVVAQTLTITAKFAEAMNLSLIHISEPTRP